MPRSAIRLALAVTLLGLTVPLSAQEIHQAVQAGELERVTALLDADPAALEMLDENGRTPMHVAALSGQLDVASLFAERGAKVDVADSRGFTPLGLAIIDLAFFFLDPNRRDELYPAVAEQIRGLGYHPDFLLAEHPGDVFLMRRD